MTREVTGVERGFESGALAGGGRARRATEPKGAEVGVRVTRAGLMASSVRKLPL